jgi:hypothetical protein
MEVLIKRKNWISTNVRQLLKIVTDPGNNQCCAIIRNNNEPTNGYEDCSSSFLAILKKNQRSGFQHILNPQKELPKSNDHLIRPSVI